MGLIEEAGRGERGRAIKIGGSKNIEERTGEC